MGIFSRREQASTESRKGETVSRTSTNSSNSSSSHSNSSNGRPSNASSAFGLAGPASASKGIAAGLASAHANLSHSHWAGIIDQDKINTPLPSAPYSSSSSHRRKKTNKAARNNAGHPGSGSRRGSNPEEESDSASEPDLPLHWNLGKHKLEKLSLGLGIGETSEPPLSSSFSYTQHGPTQQYQQQRSNPPPLASVNKTSSDIARFSIGNMLMMVDQKMSIEEQRQAAREEEERLKNAIDYEAFSTPRPEFDANFTSTAYAPAPSHEHSNQITSSKSTSQAQQPFPSRRAVLEDVQEELAASQMFAQQFRDQPLPQNQRQNTESMNSSSSMSSVTTLRDEVLDLLAYAKRASESSNLDKYDLAASSSAVNATAEASNERESSKSQSQKMDNAGGRLEKSRDAAPTPPFAGPVVVKQQQQQVDPATQIPPSLSKQPSEPLALSTKNKDQEKEKTPSKGRFAIFGGGNKEASDKSSDKEKKSKKDKSEKKHKDAKITKAAKEAAEQARVTHSAAPAPAQRISPEPTPSVVGLGLDTHREPSASAHGSSQRSFAAPVASASMPSRSVPLPFLNTNVPSSSSSSKDADTAITPTKPLATSTFSSQKASAWNAGSSPSNNASPGSKAGIGTLLPGRRHPLASASQFDIDKAGARAAMPVMNDAAVEKPHHGRKRSMSVPGNIFIPPRTQGGRSGALAPAYQMDVALYETRGRSSEDHKTPTQARYPPIEHRQIPRSADPVLHDSRTQRREVEQSMLAVPSPTVSNYSKASGVSPPASAASFAHPPRGSSQPAQVPNPFNTRHRRPSEAAPKVRPELRSAAASPVQPSIREAHTNQKSQFAQYLSVQPRHTEVRQPHSAPLPSSEWTVPSPSPSPSISAVQAESRRQKASLDKEYVIIPSREERMQQTLGSGNVRPPARPSRSPSPGIFAKAQAMAHGSQRSNTSSRSAGADARSTSTDRRKRNVSDDSVLDPTLPSITATPIPPSNVQASRAEAQSKASNTPVPIKPLSITKSRSPNRSPIPSPSVSVSSISAIGPPPASPLPLPPSPQPATSAPSSNNKVTIQLKSKLPLSQPASLPRDPSEPSLLAYRYASDQSIPALADSSATKRARIINGPIRRDTASSEHASFSENNHASTSNLSHSSSIGSRPSLSMEGSSSSEDGDEAEDDLTSVDSHGDPRYHGLLRGMLRSGTESDIPEEGDFEDEGYGKAISSPPMRAGQTVPITATRYKPAKRTVYPQAAPLRTGKPIPTSDSHDRLTQIYSDIVGELASEA